MAELMNWPPSRGPNPGHYHATYQQGRITREDIPYEDIPVKVKAKPRLVGTWYVWFQVDDVASLSLEQAIRILRGRMKGEKEEVCAEDWYQTPVQDFEHLTTLIDYPLETAVLLTIEPLTITHTWGKSRPPEVTREMRLGYFLWVVAQEYIRIYEEHEKYRIWGHAMTDLGFEGVIVHRDGFVELMMGS